jgi:hypothetical protein
VDDFPAQNIGHILGLIKFTIHIIFHVAGTLILCIRPYPMQRSIWSEYVCLDIRGQQPGPNGATYFVACTFFLSVMIQLGSKLILSSFGLSQTCLCVRSIHVMDHPVPTVLPFSLSSTLPSPGLDLAVTSLPHGLLSFLDA